MEQFHSGDNGSRASGDERGICGDVRDAVTVGCSEQGSFRTKFALVERREELLLG